MQRRTLIIAGCLAVAIAAIAIPLLMALDSTAQNAAPGSLAYETKLPDAIKAVPVLSECQPPRYDMMPDPNEGPDVAVVSYTTLAPAEDIGPALDRHFIEQGCSAVTDDFFGPGFICTDGTMGFVQVREHEVCPFVTVAIVPAP